MNDKPPLIKCPHCGNENDFYIRYSYKDVMALLDNQGNIIEENLDDAYVEGGKIIYCRKCDKQVMKMMSLNKLKAKQ